VEYQIALLKAHQVMKSLQPYCKQVEIVGDLRRRCPKVRSIELLAVSREEEVYDLFGELVAPFPLIDDWVYSCGLNFTKNGPKYKCFCWEEVKVDLFLTSQYQWGLHLALRTGSRPYARWLVTPKRKGGALPGYMQVHDGWLWSRDKKIVTLTEPNFFSCIEAEWIRPEKRTAEVWRQ